MLNKKKASIRSLCTSWLQLGSDYVTLDSLILRIKLKNIPKFKWNSCIWCLGGVSAPWLAHSVHSNKFQSDVVQQRWRKVLFFSSLSLKLVFAPDWWSDPAGAVFPFRFPGVVAFNAAEQQWQRTCFRANLVEIEEGKTVELCEHRGASVRYQPISRLLCLLWPVLHITAALGCSQDKQDCTLMLFW